jgi:hypothetical protein
MKWVDLIERIAAKMGTAARDNLPVELDKLPKGSVITAHDAITETATSAEIDCTGYNAVLIEAIITEATQNWTFSLQGALTSGGTYADLYELANTGSMAAMSYQTNASKVFLFKGIPDFIKIVATEDVDGATVTVKVQPLNM